MKTRNVASGFAILAAVLYAINVPISKLLLAEVEPTMMAAFLYLGAVLLLGFVSYGLSLQFYINAQKHLGATKTSAYYSIAPFIGVAFGIGRTPTYTFEGCNVVYSENM